MHHGQDPELELSTSRKASTFVSPGSFVCCIRQCAPSASTQSISSNCQWLHPRGNDLQSTCKFPEYAPLQAKEREQRRMELQRARAQAEVQMASERQKLVEAALPLMLDAMWAANVMDIQQTLRAVCQDVRTSPVSLASALLLRT